MSSKEKRKRVLIVDKQGVGRSNLAKSALGSELPGMEITAVGVNHPDSRRTNIHPAVVTVAKNRHGNDISDWPVQRLRPEDVDSNTLVVVFCNPNLIPYFVLQQALDVLLAPIEDPFGDDIAQKLEVTATQIAYYTWLLALAIHRRFDEIGTSRNDSGEVIPRYLTQFEPKNIEPEYSYDGFFAHALVGRSA